MVQYYIPEKKVETEKPVAEEKKKKEKFSSWSIFFAVMLTAILITLYERAFIDLPRYFNPYYSACHKASLALCETLKYETTRLLLHIALVVPLLVIALIVSFAMSKKTTKSYGKILSRAFLFSVLVAAVHLFVEFAIFLFHHYRDLGVYVILSCFGLAFVGLIIWVQRRQIRLKEVS